MKPLASICIPTFNGAQFIHEAMNSAISQTYPNLEIVVSDDASTDNTLKIIETFKAKTTIPIFIYHHEHKNIGANWNNCIKHANGEFIKFLFQDDVFLPNCIEEMIAILVKDDTLGLVATKRDFIIENPSKFTEEWVKTFKNLQYKLDLDYSKGYAIIDNSLFNDKAFLKSPLNKIGEPSTYMFRKEIIKDIGYFRNDLKQILDYEFCYRILKNYKIAILKKSLVKFRLHNEQATVKNRSYDTGDSALYSKILYDEYLPFLDEYTRVHLLKKHNKLYKLNYLIKLRLKALLIKYLKFSNNNIN